MLNWTREGFLHPSPPAASAMHNCRKQLLQVVHYPQPPVLGRHWSSFMHTHRLNQDWELSISKVACQSLKWPCHYLILSTIRESKQVQDTNIQHYIAKEKIWVQSSSTFSVSGFLFGFSISNKKGILLEIYKLLDAWKLKNYVKREAFQGHQRRVSDKMQMNEQTGLHWHLV